LNSLIICDLNFPFLRTSPKLKQVCFWFQFVVSCFAGRRIENRGAKATQLTAEERRRLKTTNEIEWVLFIISKDNYFRQIKVTKRRLWGDCNPVAPDWLYFCIKYIKTELSQVHQMKIYD